MKFLNTLREGMHISEVYLCKKRQINLTKAGKEYCSLQLQDRSTVVDGKIWDLSNPGIEDFDETDYVQIEADVTLFNNAIQLNIKRIRRADEGEYVPSDYLPVSERDFDEMKEQLNKTIASVKNKYLHALLEEFFVKDEVLVKKYCFSSAAKSVHHSFVGGLLEHSLGVAKMCEFMSEAYPYLNHDILITVALLHDIGKIREINPYPNNDYSDEGQFIGHIVIGVEMIDEKLMQIPDFPVNLATEIKHCILAHHGEFEYGSPKKPAIAEALALNLADNADSKMETMKELMQAAGENTGWLGYNKLIESNIKKTTV
ncbi:MAG: HD domain-containing protein [Lachnospiraceae bacterium]|nr:HD domain-containing protein [Candidatus Darwinimomas equi]